MDVHQPELSLLVQLSLELPGQSSLFTTRETILHFPMTKGMTNSCCKCYSASLRGRAASDLPVDWWGGPNGCLSSPFSSFLLCVLYSLHFGVLLSETF